MKLTLGFVMGSLVALAPIAGISQTTQTDGLGLPEMLRPQGKTAFEKFRADTNEHKAFAICANGAWNSVTKEDSAKKAADSVLERVRKSSGDVSAPCKVHDVDGQVFESGSTIYHSHDAAQRAVTKVELKKTSYAAEDKETGVAPTSSVNRSFHAPTPVSVPGAKVVKTTELQQLLLAQNRPILVDVMPNPVRVLPGAVKNNDIGADLTPAGDAVGQKFLEQHLKDKSRPVVFYCLSWECWLSHNAAVRAVSWGYSNVYWYRGGIYAWFDADLPLVVGGP